MSNKSLQKLLLIIAAIGLIPVALGYGLLPEKTLTPLFGFSVDNINLRHIIRALMGLYFGQIIIWFIGAFKANLRRPAMYCLVVFMLSLAGGRILSFVLDGMPHWLLIASFFLELTCGLIGLGLIIGENKPEKTLN